MLKIYKFEKYFHYHLPLSSILCIPKSSSCITHDTFQGPSTFGNPKTYLSIIKLNFSFSINDIYSSIELEVPQTEI